jgi:hypothetical protein
MPKTAPPHEVPTPPTLITYKPSGRGVAYEWLLPDVLRFVDEGIALKRGSRVPKGPYVGAYDVALSTLERVRRWLLKAQRLAEPTVKIPTPRKFRKRDGPRAYVSVRDWFAFKFFNDGVHRSFYCPRCRTSYRNGQEKFVLLGPCRSGSHGPTSRERAPTGLTCPEGHLIERD